MLEVLKQEVGSLGRPRWREMLEYVSQLHEAAIHPPYCALPYHWEEVMVGQQGLPIVFGHWETVHMALDTVVAEPRHALHQIMNLFALQQEDGLLPAPLWVVEEGIKVATHATFPPLWPVVIEEYTLRTGSEEVLVRAFDVANRQISWFHKNRLVDKDGFYYLDVMDRFWESGMIDAVRFDLEEPGFEDFDDAACVDATSHLYLLLTHAERWADRLGYEKGWLQDRRGAVRTYIQEKLYDSSSSLFFDRWVVKQQTGGIRVFETLWPVIVGAATHYQAERVLHNHILDKAAFCTRHPIPSVSINDPRFSLMGWHGPSRNSLVWWVAQGCVAYGRDQIAKQLLESALDQTAKHFETTGLIWDSYHPEGLDPTLLFGNTADTLGHNPLIAMAVLWETL